MFERLVQPHFDALYAHAYRIVGNAADAEDLVQELCLRAYTKVHELAELENPRAWLMHVLYRLAIDLWRRRQRSPLSLVDTSKEAELEETVACESAGPERRAEIEIAHGRLAHAWRFLNNEERALLTMHAIEGYSFEEMREITDLTVPALKSRLHRARIRLGRLMVREELAATRSGGSHDELSARRRLVG